MSNPLNYYTVTQHQSPFTAGDNLLNVVTLVIEPIIDPGNIWTVSAKDFGLNGITWGSNPGPMNNITTPGVNVPPEVNAVFFADSELYDVASSPNPVAGSGWSYGVAATSPPGPAGPNNKVYVFIHLDPNFVMPSSNYTIEIDIDGTPQNITNPGLFRVELISTIPDGYCITDNWPINQNANRNDDGSQTGSNNVRCVGNFWDTQQEGYNLTSSSISAYYQAMTHVWENLSATANTPIEVFKKVCWSSVGYYFPTPPNYTIQGYANNYTVTESLDNLQVTANVTSNVGTSNLIHLDTVDGIIPGMFVSAVSGTLFSVANANPGEWPYAGMDIRVINVDKVAKTIKVSEMQEYILSGDVLSFATSLPNGNVLTKEFIFTFTADSDVISGDSVIAFNADPQVIPVQSLPGNQSGGGPVPVITQITI